MLEKTVRHWPAPQQIFSAMVAASPSLLQLMQKPSNYALQSALHLSQIQQSPQEALLTVHVLLDYRAMLLPPASCQSLTPVIRSSLEKTLQNLSQHGAKPHNLSPDRL
jgi:hypothetical protein